MIKSTAKKIYLFLIFVLLYAPIITLMVLSFNNTKTRSKWNGFTGKWYLQLFQNKDIMNALYTTLIIAFLSALIATLIGTAAALGIQAMRTKARTLLLGVTNIPMLNADIVTGISLMLLFIACRFTLGFSTILLAHITFNIPYVILSVMPKLKQTSKRTYEAALDLGASPSYAFRKVVLPDIMPGIFSGFLLAFTMSLDDFVITHFTKGPGIDTLSTKIYSEVQKGNQTGNVRTVHNHVSDGSHSAFSCQYDPRRSEGQKSCRSCACRKIPQIQQIFLSSFRSCRNHACHRYRRVRIWFFLRKYVRRKSHCIQLGRLY